MVIRGEKFWALIVVIAVAAFWLGRAGIFPGGENDSEVAGPPAQLGQVGSAEERENRNDVKITVHVAGEVNQPGVYHLKEGSRIVDGIIAAGGERDNANLDVINLARRLEDGEMINIPGGSQDTAGSAGKFLSEVDSGSLEEIAGQQPDGDSSSPVDLNQADVSLLKTLSGIGAVRAEEIVAYRRENGEFNSVEELSRVPGIGEVTVENLRDHVTVK